MKLIIIAFLFTNMSEVFAVADVCESSSPVPNINAALIQFGASFCPGKCQDVYKIPAGDTQSIWYKGKCKKVINLSKSQPVFVPAKNEDFFSAKGVIKGHSTLKCVGDFYNTKKPEASKECQRGVSIRVENCANPYIVEEVEKICYPGCKYIYETASEVDTSFDPPKVIKEGKKEIRYLGGNGSPCVYYKKIKLMWDGISHHNPNDSKDVITNVAYVLNMNFDKIACSRSVQNCQGSAGKWVCFTCNPEETYAGGINKTTGSWNDVEPPKAEPVDPGHPTKGGGTSVSH